MASIFDTSAFAYVGSDDGYKNITKADMWNRYVDVVFENANYENDELKEFLYKQSEDEIVYEGANIDVHKKMKEAKSQYKASMKNIKFYVKNKQYSEAHREINIAVTNLKIMRSETKEIMKYKETSDFTALKGMVIQSVIEASKLLLVTVVTLGLGTVLAADILAVKNSTNFLSNIVQKNGDTSSSDFNQYYVNVIKLYDKMIKTLKNIDDEIHQMEKGNLPSQSKIADIKDKADSNNIASINMAKSLGFKLNNDGQDEKEFIYDLRGDENMSDLYENINEDASTVAAVGLSLILVLKENRYCKEFNNYAKQRCGDELILMSDLTHKRIASSIDGLLKKNWTINHPTELVDFLQKYDNELYNKYKDKNIIFIDQYSLKNDKPGNIFFVSISVFNPFNHRYKLSLNFNRGIEPVEYKYIPINSISKKYSAYYIIGSLYSVDRNIKDILNKTNDAYKFGIRLDETDFENLVESKYPQVKEFKNSFYDSLKNNKSKKTDDKSTTNTKDKNKISKETNVNESTFNQALWIYGDRSDYIAKLFPSYSYMDAYESAEFAEENSASVNAPMLPQGQGTGNSDPSIDDISKDLDNKINDGMSEIEEMVDEACGGQYIYTVDFLCESSLFKDTVDKVINKFKNLKTIDDNKLRRNIITKACKLYSSLVANQIRMNIEIAKDPKKGKTTVTYKKALANSIKIEKEIRKVTDRMTDAEKSFFESFKRELNQKSNITKKKLVDEAKKSAHMGKKVGIETESTDDENISSSINTLKRIYSKYLDLLEVKQEKIVYIKVGHPEKVKNHDSKIKKYQDIIDDLKKELTPIDLKKFNEFTSKADSVYSSYTPKIVKEITSSDDDDTEYIFMELNEEENKKIAQQFSKYLEDYLEESCNITTEASEVLLVSAASLATCAAVLATCAVGYAIDKGIRIRLQKQLNHYANKLHDDVIQFSKFEKRKNNNPYVIKKYSKEFYDKFVDANSEISIFTYYYEGKLMCMFISSQTSFTGNTTLFTANGSGSSYTSSKGPKQVKCVVISDICKKYQSYYEASMCVSHNIFDPCIKDFINDCKYELKHINETVEECGNGLAEEAANIDKEIENEIKKLNDKGYKTKYSSPGHDNIRIKNDDNKDGVYYGKLYNDARIMFDDKYDFPEAPKYWYWREVDGKSYLDIKPMSYNEDKGSRDEVYKKWKSNYMASLNEWIDNLPNNGESKDSNEDTNDKNSKSDEDEDNVEENVKEFYESMMFDMFSSTGYGDII